MQIVRCGITTAAVPTPIVKKKKKNKKKKKCFYYFCVCHKSLHSRLLLISVYIHKMMVVSTDSCKDSIQVMFSHCCMFEKWSIMCHSIQQDLSNPWVIVWEKLLFQISDSIFSPIRDSSDRRARRIFITSPLQNWLRIMLFCRSDSCLLVILRSLLLLYHLCYQPLNFWSPFSGNVCLILWGLPYTQVGDGEKRGKRAKAGTGTSDRAESLFHHLLSQILLPFLTIIINYIYIALFTLHTRGNLLSHHLFTHFTVKLYHSYLPYIVPKLLVNQLTVLHCSSLLPLKSWLFYTTTPALVELFGFLLGNEREQWQHSWFKCWAHTKTLPSKTCFVCCKIV